MLRRRAAPPTGLLCALLAACGPAEEEPPPSSVPDGFELGPRRPCERPTEGIDRITEEAAARGLDFTMPDTSAILGMQVLGRGGSVVASDLDGDGDADLVFGDAGGAPIVRINDGEGRFAPLDPPLAAPPLRANFPMALAAADLDGDRVPELILAGGGWAALYPSSGPAAWRAPVIAFSEPNEGANVYLTFSLGDLDGDGDLDLALPGTGSVEEGVDPEGVSHGSPDLVLLQDRRMPGWFLPPSLALVSGDKGSTTQVAHLTDRDNDGDLDLFVPADLGPPSGFWRNDGVDGDGIPRLVNDAAEVSMDLTMAAMGIDSEDLNFDGTLDYCISDVRPPRCMLSDGLGGWIDSSAVLNIFPDEPLALWGTVGWSVDLADLDHDGNPELIQASGPEGGTFHEGWTELPDLLWRGRPGGGFEDVTAETGFGSLPHHYGLATADFDGDGWLDVAVAGPASPPLLWMNRCGDNHWLEVELVGPPENSEGFGAQVLVTADGRTRMREMTGLRGQGQGLSRVHLGLAAAARVERLVVRWPDGSTQEAEGFEPDRLVTVTHPEAEEPGDDDDTPFEVSVHGLVFDPEEDRGLPGVEVSARLPGGPSVQTDGDGEFRLALPDATEVDLRAHAPGRAPTLAPIDTGLQREPGDGVALPLLDEDTLRAFHEEEMGLAFDADAGLLMVGPVGADGPLVGATVSLDTAHGGAFEFGEAGLAPGATLGEAGLQIVFGNVPEGEVEVRVQTPDGSSCLGRTRVPVEASTVTTVRLLCLDR